MKYRRTRGDGTIVIESRSAEKGFKMIFTEGGVFELNKAAADLAGMSIDALKKKIESSDFFNVKFFRVEETEKSKTSKKKAVK